MEKIKFEPYEDYKTIKKKADEYIQRILFGATFFERRGYHSKPTVFMSGDILSIIARGSERALMLSNASPTERILTVCGYNVETVQNTNVLSIGFDLL